MPGKSGGTMSHTAGVASEGAILDWNPGFAETLYNLLYRVDLGSREVGSELQNLERKYQNAVYSELIFLLSHLRFDSDEAKQHWERIVRHRDSMNKQMGKSIDLRVALVSYFVEVNQKLKNPKIIELSLFEQTQASAYQDELTGLCNFRFFREHLTREIQRGKRYSTPLSLVMIDIDNFKMYNDKNGHEIGNGAIAAIGRLLTESLRKIDVPARYGGEEFALILPATTKVGARLVAERARGRIEDHSFPYENTQPGGKLTVSMGIATCPADASEVDELVRRADNAMYVAKAQGKNQVHLYGQSRRSYRRVKTEIDGKFCELSGNYYPMTTVNVSEGGLLILVDRKLAIGSLINIKLDIPEESREIETCGRVVRVEKKASGQFEAGVRILEISGRDWDLLMRRVREAKLFRGARGLKTRQP